MGDISPTAALLAGDPAARRWLGDGVPPPAAAWAGLDRAALVAALRRQPGQSAAAARLGDPATVAVVCGQQPAVGGGPLLTLVKCAAAAAAARALSASGTPAVPLFWCASEDHDLGEANHADLVDRRGQIRRVAADLGPGRAALHHRPAAGWDDLTRALADLDGTALGAAWWRDRRPAAEDGWGAWLCRVLVDAFAGHGLIAVEGHRLRDLWSEPAARLTRHWPAADLAGVAAAQRAAGWPDALGDLATPPWFDDAADGRRAIDPAAALALPADRLSPGAAIRPILQQAALPCAIFIAGPGEIAYHARLGPLYAIAGVPRPVLRPRPQATLLPAWHRRACAAWGIDAAGLAAGAAPAHPLPPAEEPLLHHLDAAIAAASVHPAADAHLAAAAYLATAARLRRERDRIARAAQRAQRSAAERPSLAALRAWLHPRAVTRQDRVMSLAQALWCHGPGVADALVAAVGALAPGEHGFVAV